MNNNPERKDGYMETETLQLLSQAHLHSPGSLKANNNQVQRFTQFNKTNEAHIVPMFNRPLIGSQIYQVTILKSLFLIVLFFNNVVYIEIIIWIYDDDHRYINFQERYL